MSRAYSLRKKEVINVSDAKRLGYVHDVEIDFESGKIEAVIVPKGPAAAAWIIPGREYVIPWSCIVSTGKDVLLVDMESNGNGTKKY